VQAIDWLPDLDSRQTRPEVSTPLVEASALPISKHETHLPTSNALPDSILANWGAIADARFSIRMYNDIVRISSRPAGWRGPGSSALQASSLESFLRFWLRVKAEAAEPELALAPDGTMHAEWSKGPQKRLDIRFLNHDQLIFGFISGTNIIEGSDRAEIVTEMLRSHYAKPLTWKSV
jgi:hypothetical protein